MPTTLPRLNTRGPEVHALQVALERLGFGIPRDESEGERFGAGTQAAVAGLQARIASCRPALWTTSPRRR